MIYEFTGKPRTYKELAETFLNAAGLSCDIVEKEKDEYIENLKKVGLKNDAVNEIESIYDDIMNGGLDYPYHDLKTALGRDITPFDESVQEVLNSK